MARRCLIFDGDALHVDARRKAMELLRLVFEYEVLRISCESVDVRSGVAMPSLPLGFKSGPRLFQWRYRCDGQYQLYGLGFATPISESTNQIHSRWISCQTNLDYQANAGPRILPWIQESRETVACLTPLFVWLAQPTTNVPCSRHHLPNRAECTSLEHELN
ncbi:hypothetical protein ABW21_db0206352 [Orbilia brochopaga]|nr:hypothetical protein ABW21_db0206352 [Drechslerella brochopaga]